MLSEEFTAASIALLRSAVGWQSAIARRLDVDSRTVRRWLAAGETPAWVDEKLQTFMGKLETLAFPRDEWIVGDSATSDGRRREYVIHTAPPRFVARVVAVDDDGQPEPAEEPADVISGVVYSAGDAVLCELAWIDQPKAGQITALLEAAVDAVDRA
jgi:hypothetical protein